jgi:phosphoesterase RecJ-like protein
MSESSPLVKEKAPLILAEIQKAKSILLHLHPMPDPDSVGSALAMKFALEQMGKKVTLIKGDSDFPEAFAHFPGASTITQKNFFEIDQSEYDLFLILDSGSKEMISRHKPVAFPARWKTIVIDHHKTNPGYAEINLVDPTYPATAEILFDLFKEWGININADIASDLFVGIFTDTGFKYPGTTSRTFRASAELVDKIPDMPKLVAAMENSNTPELVKFDGQALSNIEVFFNVFAIAKVTNDFIVSARLPANAIRVSGTSAFMRTVRPWKISAAAAEVEKGKTKFSFRSQDGDAFDVGALAGSLGGGGHKAAAGLILDMALDEAVKTVVAKAKELYNLT